MKIIQSAFEKYVQTKSYFDQMEEHNFKDLKLHIVYAGPYYFHSWHDFRSMIINAMDKCKVDSVRVTQIGMDRRYLITQEEMVDYCLGKKDYYKKSINDDHESLFECIRLGEEFDKHASTYFLPKLTPRELKLVELKDPKYLATMDRLPVGPIPVPIDPVKREAEMKLSESKSRYVMVVCCRYTYTLPD